MTLKAFKACFKVVIVITSDTPIIISQQACRPIVLKIDPLEIETAIAIHAIVIALILAAVLVINKIVEIATVSPTLAIARAKVTMLNTESVLDQDQDPDQGPILLILVPQ